MRHLKLVKTLLASLFLLLSIPGYADNRYSEMYVFGDSLSDTGNLASVLGDFPPPYYGNRITNGKVSVEVLAEKLGLELKTSLHLLGLNVGSNYAVAGARAGGIEPIDLDTQLLAFQANNNFVAPRDALYVVFIGGNDVRDAIYSENAAQAESIINTAAAKIHKTIRVLNKAGARHFLLINVPNLALIPETRLIAAATGNSALIQQAENYSVAINKRIHEAVEGLEHSSHIDITEFDLFEFFNQVMANYTDYGFSNNQDACFFTSTGQFNPLCNYGANFDSFIFFDEIHPTAKLHGIFADAFYKELVEDD